MRHDASHRRFPFTARRCRDPRLPRSLTLPAAAICSRRRPIRRPEELAAETQTRTVLSEVYTIDRKYRSMMGPSSGQEVRLLDVEPPELVWITGYEA